MKRPALNILALALAAMALPATLSAEPSATTVVVFDGSGSIWGRIDGTKAAKLDVAKEALRAVLAKTPPSVALGFGSFGHRRRGDCSDAEVIVPPADGSVERVTTALDKLDPRGKGPYSLAVREAAKLIGARRPASIVLVTDNADNCRMDFCDLGEELAKTQPGLQVHIVAVAMERDEIPKTQCVAKSTGGRFYDARDAAQLTAAITDAMTIAIPSDGQAAAGPQLKGAPQQAVRPAPPAGTPGIAATARLGADGPAVTQPIHWRIRREGSEVAMLSFDAATVNEPVPPGRYVVEAEAHGITARDTVEVGADGPTRIRMALPAGGLLITTHAVKDATAAVYTSIAADPSPAAAIITRDDEPDLVLAPGSYRVRVEQGLASAEQTVTIAAGKSSTADIPLAAARIELSALAVADGPPVEGAVFIVATEDATSPGGWREMIRSAATQPAFVVPAGTYRVTARLGGAEAHQRVALTSGENAKRTLILGLSRLKLSVAMPGGTPTTPLEYRVFRLDDVPREAARSAAVRPDFTLGAGRYRVEVQAGSQNVRAEAAVTVTPGRDLKQDIRIACGAVSLRLAAGVGTVNDVSWKVQDATGRIVWRSGVAEPNGLLAPGRYVVRAAVRDKRFERPFDVNDGQAHTVEVGGS
jgi:Ca-activated chloride channel family protein